MQDMQVIIHFTTLKTLQMVAKRWLEKNPTSINAPKVEASLRACTVRVPWDIEV